MHRFLRHKQLDFLNLIPRWFFIPAKKNLPSLIISQSQTKILQRLYNIYLLKDVNLPSMDPTNNHGLTPKPPGMFFQDIPENLYPNQKVPEEAPRRFVDVDIFHDITLSDLMVTVLYEYDERVLKAFLNPDFEDIAFYRWANKSDDEDFSNDESDNKDFFIQKEGPIIRVSHA